MNTISTRKKAHIVLLILALAATACMELGFRKYLFKHLGYDSILAGSLPNFMAVVLITLALTVFRGESSLKTSIMGCLSMVLYECVQPLIQGRTFDLFDIAASFIGGAFVFCLLSIVDHFFKPSLQKNDNF